MDISKRYLCIIRAHVTDMMLDVEYYEFDSLNEAIKFMMYTAEDKKEVIFSSVNTDLIQVCILDRKKPRCNPTEGFIWDYSYDITK